MANLSAAICVIRGNTALASFSGSQSKIENPGHREGGATGTGPRARGIGAKSKISSRFDLAAFDICYHLSNMQFEWDAAKASANLAKHNLEFAQAIAVFRDTARLSAVDTRHPTERRENTTGLVEGYLVTVTHTNRAGVTRLISARPASRQERNRYHAYR